MNRSNLARLLSPSTVAVVGASEKLGMSNNAVLPMLDAGIEVHLVNPSRDTVYDRTAVPSLSAIGGPVDAILSLVSADRSIDVVAEAASLGCGGVAVAAGGFAEMGDEGRALQDRLVAAAGPMAIVGPNCAGFMNVRLRRNLFTGGRISLHPGSVAVLSQSGFLVRSTLCAGRERQLGFGIAASTGNEAVCGLADYIDVLADDPETRVICLVIEKIRDAPAFLDAVVKAREAGKAIIAMKLGRTEHSRAIMQSHTGAIADESWVYDVVLRQLGVVTAKDIDEMMDKAQLLAQLPQSRWRAVPGVAVVTSSGGTAGVAADAAADEGVALSDLGPLEEWVRARVPGDGSLNPLDMTGFVMRDRALMQSLFDGYAKADGVGALVLCWWASEGDEGWGRVLLEPYAEVAAASPVPLIVTPVEATGIGDWTRQFSPQGLTFCRGLSSTYRALQAMDEVVTAPPPIRRVPIARQSTTAPADGDLVTTPAGRIVRFAPAMGLLEAAGVAVAPYAIIDEDVVGKHLAIHCPEVAAALGDRLVVKLADVPHRTELGAVRLGVSGQSLVEAVEEMRAIAREHGQPGTVAVQAMVAGHGEAFIGLQPSTDLGPLVLFGRGGVLIEVARRVEGRLLPLQPGDADGLVEAVAGVAAFAGLRGQRPWPAAPLVSAVQGVARLWADHGGWLGSLDLNPLIVSDDGAVAVDALMVVQG